MAGDLFHVVNKSRRPPDLYVPKAADVMSVGEPVRLTVPFDLSLEERWKRLKPGLPKTCDAYLPQGMEGVEGFSACDVLLQAVELVGGCVDLGVAGILIGKCFFGARPALPHDLAEFVVVNPRVAERSALIATGRSASADEFLKGGLAVYARVRNDVMHLGVVQGTVMPGNRFLIAMDRRWISER